ncbi:MAG: chromate reductase, partial [Candidatus Latescibacterota bacterium]
MKKIVAFAGSNSSTSINKQLASYAAGEIPNTDVTVLDLNDFELPMYGSDYENEHGIPQAAHDFLEHIKSADGIVVSLAEHNGAYAAVFKNSYDWMSRIDGKLWNEKPMLLMATSPGGRGGQTVLGIASATFPRMGANLISTFSLPGFYDNFSKDGISDLELRTT